MRALIITLNDGLKLRVYESRSQLSGTLAQTLHEVERPDRRMISKVPQPSAVARMMLARHTCFCGALRSETIASSRRRCSGVTLTVIPALMPRA